MRSITFIICLSSLLLACQTTEQEETYDPAQVRTEIEQMFDEYHEAIKREGLRGEFGYLDISGQFFWVPPGYTRALPYHEIKQILERNADQFLSVDFHWDTLRIIPLSKDIASYTGIVTGHTVDTAGNNSTASVIETGTVIRREDGWKLLCGQTAVAPKKDPS